MGLVPRERGGSTGTGQERGHGGAHDGGRGTQPASEAHRRAPRLWRLEEKGSQMSSSFGRSSQLDLTFLVVLQPQLDDTGKDLRSEKLSPWDRNVDAIAVANVYAVDD